jgi:predicted alpha/beta-hydrolase family hydrolase
VKVVLGPGAMSTAASLAAHVDGLAARGVSAQAIELPRGRAERAAAAFARLSGPDVVVGGHSFGGRAASLAAAEAEFAGLLCFGFPLAGRADQRTAHFPRVGCPALLLSGDRDRLSPLSILREKAALLPRGRLITFPGAGHRLEGTALERALDLAAEFVRAL